MISENQVLTLAYINIRGQTGLEVSKQVQIEKILQVYNIDILHCQEANILDTTFETCNFINSSYSIISNNASNKYGTCTLVSNCLEPTNIRFDTNGRVIVFDIGEMTFANVYLPSGSDPAMRSSRENYAAETIPQLLINCKDSGCVGGDWNSIIHERDATRNQAQKMSPSLKRLVRTFSWTDSFRYLHPHDNIFSRYYEHSQHGGGATRIDRQYHWGSMNILEIKHVGLAFSDHHGVIVKVKLPESQSKFLCPRSKPQFKAKPDVVRDKVFNERLKVKFSAWSEVRQSGLNLMSWWEIIVKPGIKHLLIERGKEINKERSGYLNLLLLKQAYLVQKLQKGDMSRLASLKQVQAEVQTWYEVESEKVELQSRTDEIDTSEKVRIYHHELHAKQIKRSSILKLNTEGGAA